MIPQSRPDLGRADFGYVAGILRTGQVAGGPLVEKLEQAFRTRVGTRYAVATSSGTTALHLGLLALGVGPGDEILVPSYTCAAVLQAAQHTGARVRLLDVDEDTLNPSANTIRQRLSRRTRAVIVTHTFGFPAAMDEILRLGVPVLEDCALALGARYRGRPVGSLGTVSTFSMYATKVVCAGEGGMVCTDDRAVYGRLRDLNGPDNRTDWRPRYNYKLSDLAAGLALSQMRRLPRLLARRRHISARYRRALADCPVTVPRAVPGGRPNGYRFVLRTPHASDVIRKAQRLGIACDRPVFRPLHRYIGVPSADFAATEALQRTVVSVPAYPALTDRNVDVIARQMRQILGHRA